ncbi:hypothetical protein [Nocardia sp. NPDC058666]|uniref:hypothetical protein n=1 Tax=unclassified Nocardia TaxID=2637762 RepID=UPI0036482F82
MAPTSKQLEVALGALRQDATIWNTSATEMNGLNTSISELNFGRIEAGLFQGPVSAHEKLVEKLAARCREASGEFDEVGSTLLVCADTYEAEDLAGKHALANLW